MIIGLALIGFIYGLWFGGYYADVVGAGVVDGIRRIRINIWMDVCRRNCGLGFPEYS